jgi:tetracycline 7-halogenase / FADH2 O2-dependent halogenase
VGMTVDPRTYPKPEGMSAEADFWDLANRFPDIARQYEGMKPVREWTSTGRLQYSSKQTAGDRWFLLSHAAGFLDPLFSRGLSNTTEAVNVLAYRLLKAVKDDDFSGERFAPADRLQQSLFDYNDTLVNSAYISWSDYGLWSAVFRIWGWGAFAGVYRLLSALTDFRNDGDDRHFQRLEDVPNPGLYWPDHDGFADLYETMVKQCEAVEAGTVTAADATDLLYERLESANFVPKHFGFAERGVRFIRPNPKSLVKMLRWAKTEADPVVRQLIFDNGKETVKALLKGTKHL